MTLKTVSNLLSVHASFNGGPKKSPAKTAGEKALDSFKTLFLSKIGEGATKNTSDNEISIQEAKAIKADILKLLKELSVSDFADFVLGLKSLGQDFWGTSHSSYNETEYLVVLKNIVLPIHDTYLARIKNALDGNCITVKDANDAKEIFDAFLQASCQNTELFKGSEITPIALMHTVGLWGSTYGEDIATFSTDIDSKPYSKLAVALNESLPCGTHSRNFVEQYRNGLSQLVTKRSLGWNGIRARYYDAMHLDVYWNEESREKLNDLYKDLGRNGPQVILCKSEEKPTNAVKTGQ